MSARATRIPPILASTTAFRWSVAIGVLVVAIALLWSASPVLAAMYKWTDANGRVIYSDQPPPGNVKVESIGAPPPPANPDAAKELANKDAELRQRKMLRAEDDTKAAKARAEADKKRDQCTRVQGQIALMQSNQTVYRPNVNGEPMVMDETARRAELEQLDAWVRANCSP